MNVVTDIAAFADSQKRVLRKDEEYLFTSARAALRNVGKKGWYEALLKKTETVARRAYRREGDAGTSAGLRSALEAMHGRLEDSLKKATKPEPADLDSRAQALAASLSTAANAVGTLAAAQDDEDSPNLGKQWVTMGDEKVRPAHADMDGTYVPLRETFTVDGVDMTGPGDVRAPIELWINCRCGLAIVPLPAESLAAAAAEYEEQGIGVFLLPADGDPIFDISTERPPHVTTIFMGMTGEQEVDEEALKAAVEMVAAEFAPVDVEVKGRDVLGDDEADVAFLNRDQIADIHESLAANDVIAEAMSKVEQYPEWLPHLTLGYPETPANEGDLPSTIRLDRLALFIGKNHTEYPLGGDMSNTTVEEPVAQVDVAETVPWHGVLAPEGVLSGDGRKFLPESLSWRDLPLPLAWQKENWGGHDGSVVVGRIDNIWRDEAGLLQADGVMLSSVSEADEVIGLMSEGGLRGVSVDVDSATMQLEDEEGNVLTMDSDIGPDDVVITAFPTGRISGATLCSIPAFMEAYVALGLRPTEEPVAEPVADEGGDLAAAAATEEFVKTEDGPGWLTHPIDTDRLRDYWVRGEGAAKIGWGTPGDFNRCRAQLAKYVKAQYLNGYCANRHYDALGFWPGRPVSAETVDFSKGHALSLVSSGEKTAYPASWFKDPGLTEPTRFTITEDGRVFGHLAQWGVCHIGIPGVCTEAPSSPSGYSFFHTGVIDTDEGPVNIGRITAGCGHAGPNAKPFAAAAHYDNLGTVACRVVMGEDDIGIWFSGVVAPGVTDEMVEALRAAGSVSGDWRNIGGDLELVAALSVNVPGFPILPTMIAASGGHQTSLVAAGVVTDIGLSKKSLGDIVGEAVSNHFATIERRARMAALASEVGRDPVSRMKALAAARTGD